MAKVPAKIEDDQQYRKALQEVELLMDEDPEPTSPRGKYYYLLVLTIMDWENQMYPREPVNIRGLRGNEAARQTKLQENRLLSERHDVENVRKYLQEARANIQFTMSDNRGYGALLIACEQMYAIHKREVNKKLAAAGLTKIVR